MRFRRNGYKIPVRSRIAVQGHTYDVSLDGRRFLMIKQAGSGQRATPPQIIVVRNWFEELKRLVPAN